jgi:lipopolysaccharide/colanic/teichoic acid biosynthesis glycosyltransferase
LYQSIFKPFLDIILAVVLLVLFCPLFVLIFLVLLIHFQGNPFFIQTRIGLNEKTFSILKFRTMRDSKNQNGELLADENRTTKMGSILRNTGLDELPQLVNIISGEMSFVGPRPLLPEYLPLYDSFARKRHSIKPGITGLAQVNGGNGLEWKKRFELDVKYIETVSLRMDLTILAKTLSGAIRSKRKNIGALK